MKKQLKEDGYLLLKNFLDLSVLNDLKKEAELFFLKQFQNHISKNIEKFEEKYMFELFEKNFETFQNCGKHIQHGSIKLHSLGINNKILDTLKECGLEYPAIATRPVLFFNHQKLAKDQVYYKTPPHQDWSSIRGSNDCMIVWIPLVDVDKSMGALRVVPKSHTNGNLMSNVVGGFGAVSKYSKEDFIDVPMNKGDILIFSSFLVHESGDMDTDKIRWSCNFRYNNINDEDFIKRNYEFSYIYKPKIKE
jgi:hypothetical protein